MPDYTIRDPKTGRTLVVRGDSPPTEAELVALFAEGADQSPAPPASPPEKSLGGFGRNVASSSGRLVQDFVDMVLNPVESVNSLAGLAVSLAHKIVPAPEGADTPALEGRDQMADALGQFLFDRYGSLEKMQETAYTDPAGMLADVSGVLSGGAGVALLTGQVASRVPKLTRFGRALVTTGEAMNKADPLHWPARGVSAGLGAAGTGIVEASWRPPAAVKKQQRRRGEVARTVRTEHIFTPKQAARKEREAAQAALAAARNAPPGTTFSRSDLILDAELDAMKEARRRVGHVPESTADVYETLGRVERDIPNLDLSPEDLLKLRRNMDRQSTAHFQAQNRPLPGTPGSMEGEAMAAVGNRARVRLRDVPGVGEASDRTRRLMLTEAAATAAADRPHALTRMAALAGGAYHPGLGAAMLALDSPAVGSAAGSVMDLLSRLMLQPEVRAALAASRSQSPVRPQR